jgi:DNA (cytosine-5)-methyltransferase 1
MDLGLYRAGFEHVAFCEADPYRREVLARHWPGVPVHDDVRTFEYEGQVDLLAGGFPCQDLSVAGKRAGLAGERSGLFHEYARIADSVVRPGGFLLIENVPGLLSSNSGRDMAIVVRTLADLGFASLAYRTLDSQFFRVPQRRRRVFIVGCRAESDVPDEVLALTEGSSGNPAEGGEAREDDPRSFGQGVAGTISGRRIQRSHTELDGDGEVEEGRRSSGGRVPELAHCLETTCHDYSRADGFNMIFVDDE